MPKKQDPAAVLKRIQREGTKIVNAIKKYRKKSGWGRISDKSDVIWNSHLYPAMTALKRDLADKKYPDALGSLHGILLFMSESPDFNWFRCQTVYADKKVFLGFLKHFENACNTLYAMSDKVLCINEEFRAEMKSMMELAQKETNEALEDSFLDEYHVGKINIMDVTTMPIVDTQEQDDVAEKENAQNSDSKKTVSKAVNETDETKPHLLKKSEKHAIKLLNSITKVQNSWMFGDTGLNTHIWLHFLFPTMKAIQSDLDGKTYRDALGRVYGLLVFMNRDSYLSWFRDQEVYMDKERFTGFLKDFSSCCKSLYALDNKTLGINEPFRLDLKKLMQGVQAQVNFALIECFEKEYHSSKLDMIDMADYVPSDNESDEEEDIDDTKENETTPKKLKSE